MAAAEAKRGDDGLVRQRDVDAGVGDMLALKRAIVEKVIGAVQRVYSADVSGLRDGMLSKFERPRPEHGDLALPCFLFAKDLKDKPPAIAAKLKDELEKDLPADISGVEVGGPYINLRIGVRFMGKVVDAILDRNYLAPLPRSREKVMIEYSQPNTHKAFHVGHMRNAALGDSLVRLYEHIGHPVVAANYFGDEGAHVAKALWYFKRTWLSRHKLEEVPKENRGEFLGDKYSRSVEMLDLSTLTDMPYPGLVVAEVLSVEKHPAADAPPTWHKVVVKMGESKEQQFDVVCGGAGYKVGDKVAYAPVGTRFNKARIEPKDMKGVVSHGVMVAYHEIERDVPPELLPKEEEEGADKKKGKKGGSKPPGHNLIFVLPANAPVGVALTELGRNRANSTLPADKTVDEEFAQRSSEVAETLKKIEEKDPEMTKLFEETKEWSLQDFRAIYKWLGCRFDHDFFESQVGEESRQMVLDFHKKGVLVESDGAIGADLNAFKMGFCVLLKSNGSGLYATKDLSLARRKFDEFHIDRSIYVVDAAQTLHFQQVFKVLELMGYEKAKKCFHLAYGQVVLPSGKMSSRKGTVILFSQLRQMLHDKIMDEYLAKNKGVWSEAELEAAVSAISIATIKYGMLNITPPSDIVFELESWCSLRGNTGPYLMYAYTRLNKIRSDVVFPAGAAVDYAHLTYPAERDILRKLNDVWPTFLAAAQDFNPTLLCGYLYELAKMISSWYELDDANIKNEKNPHVQATRLRFISAVAETLRAGLALLGIKVVDRM